MLKSHKNNLVADFNKDLAKIKALTALAAYHAKDNAFDMLSDTLNTAKAKTNKIDKSITHYARKQPIKSLGICFLSGLCMGLIIKRR